MIKGIQKTRIYFLPIISTLLIISLLLEPTECITAAKNGLLLWFNTVLPSLLPFIIGCNVLFASGSIYFFEKIFRPIMKPIFNVPGCSAFAWIMGLISGYPMGAKIIAQLKADNQITDTEAQRLLSFCNNSGPFFILGAVGVGMLKDEKLGYFLLLIHFLSSFLVGLLFRFYGKEITTPVISTSKKSFQPATSIGEVLGKSVTSAMEVITQIGGYIIIFSVIGALLKQTYFIQLLAHALHIVFQNLGMTQEIALAWILGIIEMSNGVHIVSGIGNQLQLKLAIISFLLAWGGFSIHAQSIHMIRHISIKVPTYLFAKLIQGISGFILTLFLFPIYQKSNLKVVPTFSTTYYKYSSVISLSFVMATLLLYLVLIKQSQRVR